MPSVNQQFIGTVRDLSSDGSGIIGHESGQIFFVAGVWPGEKGEFRVTGFRKRVGFARLVALLEPSPYRTNSPCPYHGFGENACGGCPWQFVDYNAQLAVKEDRVAKAMERLGHGDCVLPIIGSPQDLGYRNRAQLKSDGSHIGYVAQGSNTLVDIEDCLILSDHNRRTLHDLRKSLPNPKFKPRRKASWTTLDIDEDITAEEVYINKRRPFKQANDAQNHRMQAWLTTNVQALNKKSLVIELFAGTGNFTSVLSASGFENILAVEGVEETVTALKAQSLPRVTAMTANLFDKSAVLRAVYAQKDVEILVLDPPRDGFKLMEILLDSCKNLTHIFYISCDLATFSRDIQTALRQGFHLQEVQPLDLFPHTPHVEIMAKLER